MGCFRVARTFSILVGSMGALVASPRPAVAQEPLAVFDLAAVTPPNATTREHREAAWETAHAIATLQGIVNRDAPRLFVRFLVPPLTSPENAPDDYWLKLGQRRSDWLAGRRFEAVATLEDAVRRYRRHIKGAVVYDPRVAATSNVASTIAGVESLIAVRFNRSPGSVYDRLIVKGPKLPVRVWLVQRDGTPMFTGAGTIPGVDRPSSGSAKCDAYLWAKAKYLDTGRCDGRYLGYYPDQFWIEAQHGEPVTNHLLVNHDFFVSRKAFFCDLHVWPDEAPRDDPKQKPGTDRAAFQEVLLAAYRHGGADSMIHIGGFTPWTHKYTKHTGGKHEDVATEWETARLVSAYNAFLDADAPAMSAMPNASFFSHYPLKARYPQKRWPTTDDLRHRGFLDVDGKVRVSDRQYCMIYVGDYDAAAWVYQVLPAQWNNPSRGRVPLNWAVSPVLERRVPMALAHMRETASANDHFIAADNGAGYLNPGMLQAPREISGLPDGLAAWGRHCRPMYERWDISITGFIIDGFAPGLNTDGLTVYRTFSPNGIVPQKVPPAILWDGMPVLRADHDLAMPDVEACAKHAFTRIQSRPLPFHWFRTILRTPDFQASLAAELCRLDERVRILDAPTFFELLRRFLTERPEVTTAGIGDIPKGRGVPGN